MSSTHAIGQLSFPNAGGTTTYANDSLVIQNSTPANIFEVQTAGQVVTTSYVEMSEMTAPANPAANKARLYGKTGFTGIFWKHNGAAEVDLTTSSVHPTSFSDGVKGISTCAIDSASYADIPDLSLTLTTGTKVQVVLNMTVESDTKDAGGSLRIVDSAATTTYIAGQVVTSAGSTVSFGLNYVVTGLTAGSNTFKAQWKTETDVTLTNTVSADSNRYLSVITLN